jgi:S1-C subfamily serine protease
MTRWWLAAALASTALLSSGPIGANEDTVPKGAVALQTAFEQAIAKAERSVACILVSRSPSRPGSISLADPEAVPESYGSGVIVDARGLILTNYHVIRDSAQIFVRLPGRHGNAVEAAVHAADPRSDLAVLRLLRAPPLEAITLGDGDSVRKGQFVLSIAHPFAAGFRDGSPSASWGIISNIRRRAPRQPATAEQDFARMTIHQFGTLLQMDARLNLGCSGGALVDLKGELIGLTTALAAINGSETAGGFAVPMNNRMKRIVQTLVDGKEVEYGFLGVRFARYPGQGTGVQIDGIIPGSPAAQAGLRRGEMIMSVDGLPVHDNDDLFLAVGTLLAGSEASLAVRGRVEPVRVPLVKYYVPDRMIAANRPPFARGLRVDYSSVLMQRGNGQEIPPGVYVSEVQGGSAAERAQLQDAVITHVNGREVNTPAEFYGIVTKIPGPWDLTLWSRDDDGAPRKVKLE